MTNNQIMLNALIEYENNHYSDLSTEDNKKLGILIDRHEYTERKRLAKTRKD